MSGICGRVACLLLLLSLSVGASAQSSGAAPSPSAESKAAPESAAASDDAPAETEQAPVEPAEAGPEEEPTVVEGEGEPEAARESADQAAPVPSPSDVAPERATLPLVVQQRRVLGRQLQALDSEIDESSTVLPWSILTVGLATLAAGAVVGAAQAFDCRRSCGAAGWTGWAVIGGGVAGIGGLIWLRLTNDDIENLESRRYHVAQRLQYLGWDNPE